MVAPLILGTIAALLFNTRLPARGILRGIFVMPMMATPVAIALVWTMMFHPQLGILNYLLSLVGIGPQAWVFHPATVIPSLVMVETWQWTPLVMLIVLGGLASLPSEPYESASLDGANSWHKFRYITLPMIVPFLMIAVMIRTIDALKSSTSSTPSPKAARAPPRRRSIYFSTARRSPTTTSVTDRPSRWSSSF